jgi:hypothetical protein
MKRRFVKRAVRDVSTVECGGPATAPSRVLAEETIEPLYFAVEALATGKGDVRSRLESAGLHLVALAPPHLPPAVRDDFAWIIKQLTRFPPKRREGAMKATLNRIHGSTGQKIAKRILKIFAAIQDLRFRPLL